MPFIKQTVFPVYVSESPVPAAETNELEYVSNATLSNIIRQISSVGFHTNLMFDELIQDAQKLNKRCQSLSDRIENLKLKYERNNFENDTLAKFDVHDEKPYESSYKFESSNMPESARILYNKAEPPPDLYKLNQFNDNQDCMDSFKVHFASSTNTNEYQISSNKKKRNLKKFKKIRRKSRSRNASIVSTTSSLSLDFSYLDLESSGTKQPDQKLQLENFSIPTIEERNDVDETVDSEEF